MSNNFYTMLEKEWFYNSEEETLLQKYGSICLMVYSVLLRNLTTRNTFNFSIDSLCSTLLINKKDNTAMVNKIKDAIRRLNGELFIVSLDSNCNIKANFTKIDNKNTYYGIRINEPLKEKFIMVYDFEIDKLIKYSKGKKNSLNELITHYIFICNGFNGSEKEEGYKCYFGSMDYIATKTGIENSTLLSNNKIFNELDLLLIGNPGGNIEDKKYKNSSNIYARAENKIEFDKFIEIKKSTLSKKFAKDIDKKQQDKQRQLKQYINKWKTENGIEKWMDKDCLSEEQFEELHELEMKYFNFVTSRGKKLNNPKFLTIKRDGTIKNQYTSDAEHEEEYIEVNKPKGKGLFGAAKNKVIEPIEIPYEDRPDIFEVDADNDNWGEEEPSFSDDEILKIIESEYHDEYEYVESHASENDTVKNEIKEEYRKQYDFDNWDYSKPINF